ncbi:predicted protein [Theileria orientalis strain Shintoku]|uniref:peptidyl-tRNA hydrolase n=1 Tax=Theileria orientalis strain Shintoku TaxID=869250 RepID=J4D655_THEOR|nr:predicted protein [Theileria orientalis strain Shintoku]BAM39350.1 predicted protein [Theileria orientalis strain Shintoku]|eukprot:XP_009689651.1 predicted protein [Theileria orientalis strain Shintoku]
MLLKYLKHLFHQQDFRRLYSKFKSQWQYYFVFFLLGLLTSKLFDPFNSSLPFCYRLILYNLSRFCKKIRVDDDDDEEYKLVLCVRSDLAMGKGKIAAQCGHASIGAYTDSLKNNDPYVRKWFNEGQRKVVLKINDYEEMKELKNEARRHKINTHVTRDAGRTQVPSGSYTVIAIGPGPDKVLNKITGHLKLL